MLNSLQVIRLILCVDRLLKIIISFVFINTIIRVVFAFGGAIKQPIREITKTVANEGTLYSLHQADNIVENILMRALDPAGHPLTLKPCMNCLHHIRVLMYPIHFDRQFTPPQYFPSICHSYCLKPVIASDFTTGKAAIPGKDIDESVRFFI